MMNTINLFTAAIPLTFYAASGQTGTNNIDSEINALYEGLRQGYNDLDPLKVASVYSEESLYLPSYKGSSMPIQSKAQMTKDITGWFNQLKDSGLELDIIFRIDERRVTKKVVYDVGYYTVITSGKDGPEKETGKMINIFEKEGGKWKFHVDMYSDAPDEKEVKGNSTFEG